MDETSSLYPNLSYQKSVRISIASFALVIGAPIGITSANFSFTFSITTGIVKKILKITRIKRTNIIRLLC